VCTGSRVNQEQTNSQGTMESECGQAREEEQAASVSGYVHGCINANSQGAPTP
jgi:hypothetical protein